MPLTRIFSAPLAVTPLLLCLTACSTTVLPVGMGGMGMMGMGLGTTAGGMGTEYGSGGMDMGLHLGGWGEGDSWGHTPQSPLDKALDSDPHNFGKPPATVSGTPAGSYYHPAGADRATNN